MSINVDKMDPKQNDSVHKSKPMMKRRKKNSSTSDLSSDSLSPPKKHIANGFSEEYRSSPETVFNSTFHSILPNQMNGSMNTSNGHHDNTTDNDDFKSSEHVNGFSSLNVSKNGSTLSVDSNQSPMRTTPANHHFDDSDSTSSVNKSQRQPRTPEDFYLFCQFILEYANYNEMCDQEALRNSNHSPLDSTGSAAESTISSAVNDESNHAISNAVDSSNELNGKDMDASSTMINETSSDDITKASAIDASSTNEDEDSDIDAESYNLITCYCGKPYAARPMIECSRCLTWLHLSCAKIKRKKIPDIFICVKCAKKPGQQTRATSPVSPASTATVTSTSTTPTSHNSPKDLQSSEPKENNRSKKSIGINNSQMRSDKLENSILQPLNVSAAYETGANNFDNIKTASTVSSIAVKYK